MPGSGRLHHPQPAPRFLVGNHFVILKLGRVVLDAHRDELTLDQLTAEMAGGQELAELSHELRGVDPAARSSRPTRWSTARSTRDSRRRRRPSSGPSSQMAREPQTTVSEEK